MIAVKPNPKDWKRVIYIASKKSISLDDEGNEIVIYDTPIKYEFNYQPVSTSSEIAEFGEKSNEMVKMVIPITYENVFKEFDVAYLYGATPDGEMNNGDNANYRLLAPRIGNSAIVIYFKSLMGK